MAEAKTVHSPALTYFSMISLPSSNYLPSLRPTVIAWKLIACYAAFEAALQLFLPGMTVEGPISPCGNRSVYKANGMQAYAVTLITYLSLWWFGILNSAIVYDHLGEMYPTLNFGSFIFCIFLYTKGMELYPRTGKNFDIKVFTNCRFGMILSEENGKVAASMIVNTVLMLVHVTKFFGWASCVPNLCKTYYPSSQPCPSNHSLTNHTSYPPIPITCSYLHLSPHHNPKVRKDAFIAFGSGLNFCNTQSSLLFPSSTPSLGQTTSALGQSTMALSVLIYLPLFFSTILVIMNFRRLLLYRVVGKTFKSFFEKFRFKSNCYQT
ncbi:hypothetical protein PVL29_000425 [Vitis rotundifolia]|uniref:7-dehydrocholesterol reductase n=1 Tax=Vitis rotundifolia TaxID=103349 RepID=A0AA39AJU5_VITRO|nr:hypothetical protein PVL29_000425 [Vitis rotundifolia]